ncbi:3'(2'),5'-bisphosphate nucleotidase CysQ [Xanthovirga aplysinae]|uniref:3'(2'),5'-bisphosphate nucleotidase CysQ n=1 Tax=Xanthovirga aplysinae TaxID=2529853 RepID=UPI0012BD2512|nr:3'(2'),5'-bisphosphate nucleotidase CysQ [Xanthovirga aplysinae]MTI32261.1 3'(2'),5'-bisphosphate nucleotidase [Xanthovirga aplysinae]
MDRGKIKPLLELAKDAALKAGIKILEVYQNEELDVELKGDQSPLTKADKLAHQEIVKILENSPLPILSEEGKNIPYEERKGWEYFWMVDPLDGTKEFIKKNGEFTVNIALINGQKSIMGVVYSPVLKKLYWGGKDLGAFMQEGNEAIIQLKKRETVDLSQEGIRVVASRSHLNNETEEFLSSLNSPEIVSMGSSLKFMLLAEGKADVYPRFAPTMEWDTAAAHAVINGIGYVVRDQSGKGAEELVYNKENLLNPSFLGIK